MAKAESRVFPLASIVLVTVLALSSVYVVRSQACAAMVSAWDRQVNLFVAPETTVREVLERASCFGTGRLLRSRSRRWRMVQRSRLAGVSRFVARDGKISVIVTCCECLGRSDLAQVVKPRTL